MWHYELFSQLFSQKWGEKFYLWREAVIPAPLRVPPWGGREGSFNITNCLHFPSSGNLHSTLHCIALTQWSKSLPEHSLKRYQYLFKKGVFKGGGRKFSHLLHKCPRTRLDQNLKNLCLKFFYLLWEHVHNWNRRWARNALT